MKKLFDGLVAQQREIETLKVKVQALERLRPRVRSLENRIGK